jgi:hypothetical protein
LLIGSQMIGYGIAGICRRWLVYPGDMIWPLQLQASNFLNTMHRDKNPPVGRWTISRYRLFFLAMIACFGYSFLPHFIPFLSTIDIFTMIWPKSKIVNLLFGRKLGLALLPMTLSWQTVIAWLGRLARHIIYTNNIQERRKLFRLPLMSQSLLGWFFGFGSSLE